jgi:hypothetical protein
LCCALAGTYCADKIGRITIGIISTGLLTIFLFMIGGLTQSMYNYVSNFNKNELLTCYLEFDTDSVNTSDIYGTVAAIFLFQGAYGFGWTPLLYLYPPEFLNYPIRANDTQLFTFALNGAAYVSFPL